MDVFILFVCGLYIFSLVFFLSVLRLMVTCPYTILFHLNMHRKSAMLLWFPRNYSFTCLKFFFPSLRLPIKMTSTLGSITAASPAPTFQIYLLRLCTVLLYPMTNHTCLNTSYTGMFTVSYGSFHLQQLQLSKRFLYVTQ